MAESIVVSRVIPSRPERLFQAWLNEDEHSKMTGSFAQAQKDGSFLAWDGYIKARTLEKKAYAKIVQTWRTTEFPHDAPDSVLTVMFEPAKEGTKVTFDHRNIPDGQGSNYEVGWNDFYLDPMERYFGSAQGKLKDAEDALEAAAEAAGEAVEEAIEEAQEQIDQAAEKAIAAVETAKKGAQRQALKAVKTAKQVQAKAVKGAKALGKKVRALVTKGAAKKAAGKAKKAAPKKAAGKAKKPAKKGAAKKKR